ncbi:MAG: flippase-like domain-containing protein [Anaerolineae bacterium]|nr:flippase-like domain-containing protein [Anaerolineae bacterium]
MKRWQLGLLGAVVSILAVYFIVRQIDLVALGQALAEAHYAYLVPSALLLVAGLWTRAIRWRVLLSDGLPLYRAFSISNLAYLANSVLPLRMGEVVRAYLATRSTPPVPVFKSASTIIVERLLDMLAVVVLIGLALAGGVLPNELRAASAFAVPAVMVGFVVLVILSSRRAFTHRMFRWVVARLPLKQSAQSLSIWLDHFLDGLAPLTQPYALFLTLLWTSISWGFSVAAGYILMLAFFDQASWVATCLFIAAASLVIAIPAVPGSIGPYELSIMVALGAVGYGEPRDTAAAFALVVHGLNLGLYAFMGLIGFVQEGISLGQLSRGVQEMRQQRMVTQDAASTD